MLQNYKSPIVIMSLDRLSTGMCAFKWVDPSNCLSIHPGGDLTGTRVCCVPTNSSGENIKRDQLFPKTPKEHRRKNTVTAKKNTVNSDVSTLRVTDSWKVTTDVWLQMPATVNSMFSLL